MKNFDLGSFIFPLIKSIIPQRASFSHAGTNIVEFHLCIKMGLQKILFMLVMLIYFVPPCIMPSGVVSESIEFWDNNGDTHVQE